MLIKTWRALRRGEKTEEGFTCRCLIFFHRSVYPVCFVYGQSTLQTFASIALSVRGVKRCDSPTDSCLTKSPSCRCSYSSKSTVLLVQPASTLGAFCQHTHTNIDIPAKYSKYRPGQGSVCGLEVCLQSLCVTGFNCHKIPKGWNSNPEYPRGWSSEEGMHELLVRLGRSTLVLGSRVVQLQGSTSREGVPALQSAPQEWAWKARASPWLDAAHTQ